MNSNNNPAVDPQLNNNISASVGAEDTSTSSKPAVTNHVPDAHWSGQILPTLSPEESARLIELENTIKAGKKAFIEVGCALAEIKAKKLYKPEHTTFEMYCLQGFNAIICNDNLADVVKSHKKSYKRTVLPKEDQRMLATRVHFYNLPFTRLLKAFNKVNRRANLTLGEAQLIWVSLLYVDSIRQFVYEKIDMSDERHDPTLTLGELYDEYLKFCDRMQMYPDSHDRFVYIMRTGYYDCVKTVFPTLESLVAQTL